MGSGCGVEIGVSRSWGGGVLVGGGGHRVAMEMCVRSRVGM